MQTFPRWQRRAVVEFLRRWTLKCVQNLMFEIYIYALALQRMVFRCKSYRSKVCNSCLLGWYLRQQITLILFILLHCLHVHPFGVLTIWWEIRFYRPPVNRFLFNKRFICFYRNNKPLYCKKSVHVENPFCLRLCHSEIDIERTRINLL